MMRLHQFIIASLLILLFGASISGRNVLDLNLGFLPRTQQFARAREAVGKLKRGDGCGRGLIPYRYPRFFSRKQRITHPLCRVESKDPEAKGGDQQPSPVSAADINEYISKQVPQMCMDEADITNIGNVFLLNEEQKTVKRIARNGKITVYTFKEYYEAFANQTPPKQSDSSSSSSSRKQPKPEIDPKEKVADAIKMSFLVKYLFSYPENVF
eukprot:jgi/Bigna1/78806/fgenesh1_pg.57_\